MSISGSSGFSEAPDATRAVRMAPETLAGGSAVQFPELVEKAARGFALMLMLNLALICLAWFCWRDGRPFVAGLVASIPAGCAARLLFRKATGI